MTSKSFSLRARAAISTLLVVSGVVLGLLALTSYFVGDRPGPGIVSVASAAVADPSCPAIGFSHSTLVDFSFTGGEPFINSAPVNILPNTPKFTPAGSPFVSAPFGLSTTSSLLWKSIDGGRSFIALGAPITRDPAVGPGGGDTHQDFDHLGRFYFNDLSAACVTTAVSDDGGNTFPKTTPLTCVGPGDPTTVTDDRQWSGAFGGSDLLNPADPASRGYMTTRNFVSVSGISNFHLARTRNGGVTWNEYVQSVGNVTQSGPLVMDKTKRTIDGTAYILGYQIYQVGGTQLRLFRIRDDDSGGATVAVDNLPIITPGGSVANVFPTIAVGRDGGLYVTWSDGKQIRMVTSQDRGDTWSAPKVVSAEAPPAAKIMPWVIAGDAGRANVVWYQSTDGLGNASSNRWNIFMAQTLNGYDASATFETTPVSEHTVHFGEICLRGLNCDLEGRDRSFLEFPSITLDHRGAAMVIWNDNTNQSGVTAATPQDVTGAAYVMFAKQTKGASLFADVGTLDQAPGTVGIAQPLSGQQVTTSSLAVSGTHTLPPGTFDRDEPEDAKFPDHGPEIGPNVPALDIRQVTVTDDATNMVVTMQLADTSAIAMNAAAPATGGDGLLYLAQWDYDQSTTEAIDRVFWVAAEVRAGVPKGRTGTLGVIRSATSKKYIVYNAVENDSLQVNAVVTPGAPGTITLTIPKSLVGAPPNGAQLKSFTAYAMSERGPLTSCAANTQASCETVFSPASLPIKVDASGAFTYIVGQGPRFDGTVEFSVDDQNFSNPRSATLDSSNNNWQGQLGPSDLTPGAHTLYARQRISCNTSSAIVSVPFTVPGGPPPPPPPSGAVSFGEATYSVGEGGPTATISVIREGGTAGAISVDYAASDNTATAGSDYTATSGTLTFAEGEARKQFTIAVSNDDVVEADETVNLTLSNPGGGATLGSIPAAVLTIIDDDPPPGNAGTLQFSAASYREVEDAGSATITVTRTGGSTGSVSVSYATSDGTAVANSDYTPASGTLTFADGEATKTFTVALADDPSSEPDESVNLTLSDPTGSATLGTPATATLTIVDTDGSGPSAVSFAEATYSVGEAGPTATISVIREGGTAGAISVDYATSDNTASAGSDYTAASAKLTFADGEARKQFTISVSNDAAVEANETVNLTLSNPGGGATLGSIPAAVLTIIDDDTPPGSPGTLQFSAASYREVEDAGSATITVTRTGGSTGSVSVSYATSDGTAVANSDYTPASGSLTFAEGEATKTFSVAVADNPSSEPDENVNLTLSSPTGGATLGTLATATLTIVDTDRSEPPAQLLNISTRVRVRGGDSVGIAGFIVTGKGDKRIIVRGIGPSLTSDGQPLAGRLADPVVELFDENGVFITANDNWKESPEVAEIESSGLAPSDDAEAGIARTLQPGLYTAVISGKNEGEGIALIEVYDRDRGGDSELANISTRGFADTGDNLLIGGFIAGARSGPTNIVVRAIGPSLTNRGVAGALQDPTAELIDANGQSLEFSDDWKTSGDEVEITARGLAPQDDRESAGFQTVPPGNYTVIVRGKAETTGVGLVEIYNVK